MSRGPGRWQRLLLAELDEYDVVPVSYVARAQAADGRPSRSDLVAIRRAAKQLTITGKARAIYRWGEDLNGTRKGLLCLTPADSDIPSSYRALSGEPDWLAESSETTEVLEQRRQDRIRGEAVNALRVHLPESYGTEPERRRIALEIYDNSGASLDEFKAAIEQARTEGDVTRESLARILGN